MRAQRMSPKMPASVTPIASATAMQPAGIASMAERVEMGLDHDSGVARSSRAGTKRSVNALPTRRGWPALSGRVPRIQTLRRPFFSSSVVKVAVVTREKVSTMSRSRLIGELGERAEDFRPILREAVEELAHALRVGADVALADARHAAHVHARCPSPRDGCARRCRRGSRTTRCARWPRCARPRHPRRALPSPWRARRRWRAASRRPAVSRGAAA